MPLIRALGIVKKCAAKTNMALGDLDAKLGEAIVAAAEEVIDGKHDGEFPLVVWQTGSGTQTNMNANEVISNRAIEMLGGEKGCEEAGASERPCQQRPILERQYSPPRCTSPPRWPMKESLLPGARSSGARAGGQGARRSKDIIKIGRTHLQDATPVTLGQEFSGYATQVRYGIERVKAALPRIYMLAQGGTAVGTGLNSHHRLRRRCSPKRSPR